MQTFHWHKLLSSHELRAQLMLSQLGVDFCKVIGMATLWNSSFCSQLNCTLRILLKQNSINCFKFQCRKCYKGQTMIQSHCSSLRNINEPKILILTGILSKIDEENQKNIMQYFPQEPYAVNLMCKYKLWIKIYH